MEKIKAFGVGFLGIGFFLLAGGMATMNGAMKAPPLATAGVLALAGAVVLFTIIMLRRA